MLKYSLAKIRRRPVIFVITLLFGAVVSAVLCSLNANNLAAENHFRSIYHGIEVTGTVTNATGSKSDGLFIPDYICTLFTGEIPALPSDFKDLARSVEIKGSMDFSYQGETYSLVGTNSMSFDQALLPENGCVITWYSGYDEAGFLTGENLCLVPESIGEDIDSVAVDSVNLNVVGRYSGEQKKFFTSWNTYLNISKGSGGFGEACALRMVLKDNDSLELFRQTAAEHFASPDPNAGPDSSKLAFSINDSALTQAESSLKNSLRVNSIVGTLILALSAVSGFLIGFMVIRGSKHEIALKRILGQSGWAIFGDFAFGQMLPAVLGAVIGGGYFLWKPLPTILLFLILLFAGISTALALFLKNNLMLMIKDE